MDVEEMNATEMNRMSENMNRTISKFGDLLERYLRNRGVDQPAYGILIALYTVIIVVGAMGNALVILSVVRKPAMRTPRNMFIVNLAISDMLLCTFTMPLTLMEILTVYFPLGNSELLCKLVGTMQATSTFVSTISIVAIALDRYQVIIYPTRENLQLVGAAIILCVIWTLAVLLSLPLFIYKKITSHHFNFNDTNVVMNYCYENWPPYLDRYVYSIFSFIFQYSLPIIIVSAAYIRILYKLRHRFAAGFVAHDDYKNSRQQVRSRRLQRTNMLLVSISVIFFTSWMPLNLFNLIADTLDIDFTTQSMKIVYAVCHMMGMSSACWNPVLYGWLNDNFWKEFQDIMCIKSNSSNTRARDLDDKRGSSNRKTTGSTEMSLLTKC
ncbi:neuropeptide F receptor isoform X2 [Atheta coriaria]|uniref:neuropeptide F receptor isoform X2 n=1 Tax=Dalotia coriaria TaxID=877792 RepID=UPI0031F3BD6C